MYDFKWDHTARTKLIAFEAHYLDRYNGGTVGMSFGENFLLMDIMPNTTSRKSEARENNNMTFYFEKIRFC